LLLSCAGVGLLTLDGAANVGEANLHDLLLGDAFCVLAACFYACYDVRVNTWSKRAATLPLTTYKTAFQSLYACTALGGLIVSGLPQGRAITDWAAQVHYKALQKPLEWR
jgi:drug/metabolite transporter (DMT)-like permease